MKLKKKKEESEKEEMSSPWQSKHRPAKMQEPYEYATENISDKEPALLPHVRLLIPTLKVSSFLDPENTKVKLKKLRLKLRETFPPVQQKHEELFTNSHFT